MGNRAQKSRCDHVRIPMSIWRASVAFVFLGLVPSTNPSNIQSSHGSFFFLGATSTSIVIAADSRVTNSGAPDSKTDKLMPLGSAGVCFIGGYSVFGNMNFEKMIRDWIRLNPKATLPNAHESIDKELLASMNAFRRRYPWWNPGDPNHPDKPFSYFVCAGYYMGLQQFYASLYTATVRDIGDEPDTPKIPAGRCRTLGWKNVCDEIMTGNATTKLSQFKSDPAAVKYRKALESDNVSSISTDDLLRLSRVCLEATESPAGRKFDANAKKVGPPNHYAVIDQRDGFKWVNRR